VGPPTTFADLDVNGDGALTVEEASLDATLSMNFNQADKDGDGRLTAEEHEASTAEQDQY
jgi:hypothetical protein